MLRWIRRLAVLAALDIVPREELARCVALGELALDGRLVAVAGALPAAVATRIENTPGWRDELLRRTGRIPIWTR